MNPALTDNASAVKTPFEELDENFDRLDREVGENFNQLDRQVEDFLRPISDAELKVYWPWNQENYRDKVQIDLRAALRTEDATKAQERFTFYQAVEDILAQWTATGPQEVEPAYRTLISRYEDIRCKYRYLLLEASVSRFQDFHAKTNAKMDNLDTLLKDFISVPLRARALLERGKWYERRFIEGELQLAELASSTIRIANTIQESILPRTEDEHVYAFDACFTFANHMAHDPKVVNETKCVRTLYMLLDTCKLAQQLPMDLRKLAESQLLSAMQVLTQALSRSKEQHGNLPEIGLNALKAWARGGRQAETLTEASLYHLE